VFAVACVQVAVIIGMIGGETEVLHHKSHMTRPGKPTTNLLSYGNEFALPYFIPFL
jgi:hypothetical protein